MCAAERVTITKWRRKTHRIINDWWIFTIRVCVNLLFPFCLRYELFCFKFVAAIVLFNIHFALIFWVLVFTFALRLTDFASFKWEHNVFTFCSLSLSLVSNLPKFTILNCVVQILFDILMLVIMSLLQFNVYEFCSPTHSPNWSRWARVRGAFFLFL